MGLRKDDCSMVWREPLFKVVDEEERPGDADESLID